MDDSNPGGVLDVIFEPQNLYGPTNAIDRERDEQYGDFFEANPFEYEVNEHDIQAFFQMNEQEIENRLNIDYLDHFIKGSELDCRICGAPFALQYRRRPLKELM